MVLLVASCGESFPTEAALLQRAEAAAEAASNASFRGHPWAAWKDVYRFLTPEYRKRCGSRDRFEMEVHSNLMGLAAEAVRDGTLVLDGALVLDGVRLLEGNVRSLYVRQLSYQVTKVTVNGTEGQVELKVLYQGVPVALGGDHEPEYWVFDGGQWWIESSRYWMDTEEREGEGCRWERIPSIPIY